MLPLRGAWVQSLAGSQDPHALLRGQKKNFFFNIEFAFQHFPGVSLICHFVLRLHEFFGREFLNDPFGECVHLAAEKYISSFTLSHRQRNKMHLF